VVSVNLGLLCSNEGLELSAVVDAAAEGRLPADIRIVIADRHSAALTLARSAGFYGVFIPRAPYHANRDGFERRLVEVLNQAEARLIVLAGYEREPGPVLAGAFPGRIFGRGLGPEELVGLLTEKIGLFSLVDSPDPGPDPYSGGRP
jgi:folate-dependent phosphoribosylglycinamide formyltransferase PurN